MNNNLSAQLEIAKTQVGSGWGWLLDLLFNSFSSAENTWIKLAGQNRWGKSELPFLGIQVTSTKEKYAQLRNYVDFSPVEHDWIKFDKDSYEARLQDVIPSLQGQIAMIEKVSGGICELSGERGEIRSVRGWLKCLSQKEWEKTLDNG